jgi:hypothetical protein
MPPTATHPEAISARTEPSAPRLDLYAPIHKALRLAMSETLVLVGRLDVFDPEETLGTLARVERLLDLLHLHVEHENAFVHAAIEARRPSATQRTAHEHVEHLESIEALHAECRTLKAARPDARPPLALRLYRHLALFVAENFQHMHVEETANNAALWALYTDDELVELNQRLLTTITPLQHLEAARWMVPALAPVERAGMLQGARAGMPPEAFLGLLEHVRPHVDARGWSKLTQALGVAERPGRPA